MQEITKEQKKELLKKFTEKAKELAKKDYDYHYFLSKQNKTCYYASWSNKLPEHYKLHYKQGVIFLIHFLPKNCGNVCYHSEVLADCIATVRTGNKYKYYHCQHLVGDCPHKY
jgi:hypothetical protein